MSTKDIMAGRNATGAHTNERILRPKFASTKLLSPNEVHFTFDKWRARVMILFTPPIAFGQP